MSSMIKILTTRAIIAGLFVLRAENGEAKIKTRKIYYVITN